MRQGIDDYGHSGQRRVTIDRQVYEELTRQADAYRDLATTIGTADQLMQLLIDAPGVRELLMQEYADWTARKAASASANAISQQTAGHTFEPGLLQRRHQLGQLAEQFHQRHGGEYQGGPVDWSTGRPATPGERDRVEYRFPALRWPLTRTTPPACD